MNWFRLTLRFNITIAAKIKFIGLPFIFIIISIRSFKVEFFSLLSRRGFFLGLRFSFFFRWIILFCLNSIIFLETMIESSWKVILIVRNILLSLRFFLNWLQTRHFWFFLFYFFRREIIFISLNFYILVNIYILSKSAWLILEWVFNISASLSSRLPNKTIIQWWENMYS